MKALRGRGTAAALLATSLALAACGGSGAEAPVVLSEPLVLDAAGASNPTAAGSPGDSAAYVAWVSTEGGESNVWMARVGPGGVAPEPVRVNDIPGDAAPHLQAPARVAVGPGGAVYVLWQNNTYVEGRRFPASDLRFARSSDGGRTFEPAVTVNDDAGGPPSSHTFHDMLVTPEGQVVVSWLDGRELPAPTGASGHAAHTLEGAGPSIRVAVSDDGGRTFGAGVVVDRNTCPCCRTAMAAGADGTLYVAWRKVFDGPQGQVRDVVVARSPDGGATWEEPRRVHDDGWRFQGCPHAGPALAVDGDGALHAAWYTGREGGAGVWRTRSEPGGGTFGAASPLHVGDGVPPSQAALVTAASGGVWTAWEERGVGRRAVRVTPPSRGAGALEVAGTNPALAPWGESVLVAWLAGDSVMVARAAAPVDRAGAEGVTRVSHPTRTPEPRS